MTSQLLTVFPVQTKSSSGFFRYSRNTIPFSLAVYDDRLTFKLLGIVPIFAIRRRDILAVEKDKEFLVGLTGVFNAIFITYKKGTKTKERVISIFSKEKSVHLFDVIKEWGSKV